MTDEVTAPPSYRCPDPQCQAMVECWLDGNVWRYTRHSQANLVEWIGIGVHGVGRGCRQSYMVAQGVEPMR